MPLDPNTIEIAPPAVVPNPMTILEPHIEAIDAMLRQPPWHEHEFVEDEDRERPAGRAYEVTALSAQQWQHLETIYTKAGWKVGKCGGSNESYMTAPENQRRFLVFCPKDRWRSK